MFLEKDKKLSRKSRVTNVKKKKKLWPSNFSIHKLEIRTEKNVGRKKNESF